MKNCSYKTKGTCSTQIDFSIDNEKNLRNLKFTRGCNGNSKGLEALCEGLEATLVIKKLKGITCKEKKTSCPDQLAKAISEALLEMK